MVKYHAPLLQSSSSAAKAAVNSELSCILWGNECIRVREQTHGEIWLAGLVIVPAEAWPTFRRIGVKPHCKQI